MAISPHHATRGVSRKLVLDKRYILRINGIAALGGILFGFDTAIISGTISFFSEHFRLNALQTGFAVGCISIGAAIGALLSGTVSDRIGRKKILLISSVLFAITGVGTGWATTYEALVTFRIISGIAIGIAASICPVYIAEVTPAFLRGRLVAFYQLAVTIGFLAAYLAIYLLLTTGENNWRWMFSAQSLPALLFFLGLFLVSESPRWLLSKGRNEEAKRVLAKIGGSDYADEETAAIEASYETDDEPNKDHILKGKFLPIIMIGIVVAFASQIAPLTIYAPEIFKQVGVAEDSAFKQLVLLGIILFLFTFIAIFSIDKLGRRKLLLNGSLFISFILLALSLINHFNLSAYWTLTFILLFVAVYAATLGPVTWVILSEIFPNRIRGRAMSIATLSLWLASFLASSLFPIMKSQLGMTQTFAIYAALYILFLLYAFFKIPETKGKTLEEIEIKLLKKSE